MLKLRMTPSSTMGHYVLTEREDTEYSHLLAFTLFSPDGETDNHSLLLTGHSRFESWSRQFEAECS